MCGEGKGGRALGELGMIWLLLSGLVTQVCCLCENSYVLYTFLYVHYILIKKLIKKLFPVIKKAPWTGGKKIELVKYINNWS